MISIETRYGKYRYEVTDIRIAEENDTSAYDLNASEDNLNFVYLLSVRSDQPDYTALLCLC